MSYLSFASARVRLGGVIGSEEANGSIWLPRGHTFKLRECIPGTGYRVPDSVAYAARLIPHDQEGTILR